MTSPDSASVAVLIEMSGAYGRGLIQGIAEYVRSRTAWSLHVEETGPLSTVPPWLRIWRGDAIIARIETARIAGSLLARRIPVVNVSGRASPAGIPQVDLDNAGVCRLAVDHLRQRGFRHLAYCGDPRFQWSNWRREYFAQAVAGAAGTCHILDYDDSAPDPRRLRAWLRALPKPAGILACNDRRGCAVLEACHGMDLAVPREVAVLGVDNDEILCTLARPQLSSIVPDPQGIGYLAARTLHEMLQGRRPDAVPRWVGPLTVCSRQSTDSAAVSDWHVSQAIRIIEGRATHELHVDDLAVQVGTSRRYLEKRFRAVLGCSIHDEILRVRMATAQRLLNTTSLALKDVAVRSGFRRADYLSAVFRERLGLSPSQYRERRS